MLTRNGASFLRRVLNSDRSDRFALQLSIDVFSVVPRLRSDIANPIDFTCVTIRLLLVVGLVYFRHRWSGGRDRHGQCFFCNTHLLYGESCRSQSERKSEDRRRSFV